MTDLTPETRAEWASDAYVGQSRILDLLDALDKAERERDEARAALARVREVHERYFDTDRKPGSWDDHLGTPDPEPEDVWRFDRDFRAALAGTDPTDTEGDDRD